MGNFLCKSIHYYDGNVKNCLCLACGESACCAKFYVGNVCCSKASTCICCWTGDPNKLATPEFKKVVAKSLEEK